MEHICKCGNAFFSTCTLNKHQQNCDFMLEKYSVVDLYNTSKESNQKVVSDFVKLCHKEIVEAMNNGLFGVSVPYTDIIGRLKEVNPRLKNLFSGINISLDTENKELDFAWDVENVLKVKEPRIYDIEHGCIKLNELILKMDSESYCPVIAWTHVKAENFIDSIMRGMPIPSMYFHQNDEGFHCLDGHNRISTLIDYINPKPTDDKNPVAWIKRPKLSTKDTVEHVYYKETYVMVKYVSLMNNEETNNIYRFMTNEERSIFINYTLPVFIINGKLTTEEQDYIVEQINNVQDISKFRRKGSNEDNEEPLGYFSGYKENNIILGKKRMGKSAFLNFGT